MKLCIFGAGAIGAYLGACLTAGGRDEVVLVARGARCAAMRGDGVRIQRAGRAAQAVAVACTDSPRSLPTQDVVFLTTKAHDAPSAAHEVAALLGPETTVVTAMNGVPWWYFADLTGPHRGATLRSVDPGGILKDAILASRVVGAVVWTAATMVEPGVVQVREAMRLALGEPSGADTERLRHIRAALEATGVEVVTTRDIRAEVWLKLWGNLAFNPVSVLTRATLSGIARDPGGRAAVRAMMVEAEAVAHALGVRFPVDVDQRISMAEGIGPHPTSSLQDLDAGKAVELAALSGAVLEMAALVGVATPTLALVHGLAQLRVRDIVPQANVGAITSR